MAFFWKLKCSPKLRHFVWQILFGTLPVFKNLKTRGIDCDLRCSMCGADEESTNHVLFECPTALQSWALSKIPSSPAIFPNSPSVFTNMDYLFWRVKREDEFEYFPWILWYIWKTRNDKIYSNRNDNPQEILRQADVESTVWKEAQLAHGASANTLGGKVQQASDCLSLENIRICYIDGAWKEEDVFTGQGWFCRQNGSTYVIMGAMNLRRSFSPLHAECEALIWVMKCMKTLQYSDVLFATDCSHWWRWCRPLKNSQLSLHTWKNLFAVRLSFLTFESDIYQEHKTLCRTSLHEVWGVLLQLCFMSILPHRFGLLNRVVSLLNSSLL